MTLKEKVQMALQAELSPLGYKFIKTQSMFIKKIDRFSFVGILCEIDRYIRGYTKVFVVARGEYRDIEYVLNTIEKKTKSSRYHHGINCRLDWMMPKDEYDLDDFYLCENASEEVNSQKIELLLSRIRSYVLPYIEDLSHRDTALKKFIELDEKGLMFTQEKTIPIVYYIWMHDKSAALEYIEKKRQKLYNNVAPEEWERLEPYRNGKIYSDEECPLLASYYDNYIHEMEQFKEWLKTQDDYADIPAPPVSVSKPKTKPHKEIHPEEKENRLKAALTSLVKTCSSKLKREE